MIKRRAARRPRYIQRGLMVIGGLVLKVGY